MPTGSGGMGGDYVHIDEVPHVVLFDLGQSLGAAVIGIARILALVLLKHAGPLKESGASRGGDSGVPCRAARLHGGNGFGSWCCRCSAEQEREPWKTQYSKR